MHIATISSKNQVTLPAALLRKLGLKPGHKIIFEEQHGELKAKPVKGSIIDDIIKNFHPVVPAYLKGKTWEEIKEISDKKYTKYLAKKHKHTKPKNEKNHY